MLYRWAGGSASSTSSSCEAVSQLSGLVTLVKLLTFTSNWSDLIHGEQNPWWLTLMDQSPLSRNFFEPLPVFELISLLTCFLFSEKLRLCRGPFQGHLTKKIEQEMISYQ